MIVGAVVANDAAEGGGRASAGAEAEASWAVNAAGNEPKSSSSDDVSIGAGSACGVHLVLLRQQPLQLQVSRSIGSPGTSSVDSDSSLTPNTAALEADAEA